MSVYFICIVLFFLFFFFNIFFLLVFFLFYYILIFFFFFFFFQAEDGIRDLTVTGVQTCALPISIDIEPVGAAATLIAERFRRAGRTPSPHSITLLYAAVMSNTQSLLGSDRKSVV